MGLLGGGGRVPGGGGGVVGGWEWFLQVGGK